MNNFHIRTCSVQWNRHIAISLNTRVLQKVASKVMSSQIQLSNRLNQNFSSVCHIRNMSKFVATAIHSP